MYHVVRWANRNPGTGAINAPRFRLASLLIAIAVAALNLGIVQAFRDQPGEGRLLTFLPTVNVLAALALTGLRRLRLRAFAVGFVAAGTASLVGFHLWVDANPWTFLRYAEPLSRAIERAIPSAIPDLHTAAVFAVLAAVFVVPHVIAGLVGGGMAASGWVMLRRHGNVSRQARITAGG